VKGAAATVLALLLTMPSSDTRAFTISTGFSPGCHEQISVNAFALFLEQTEVTGRTESLPPIWRRVAYTLADQLGVNVASDEEALLLLSLVVGVRSPDTGGHSVANITQLRSLHADRDPDGQYLHALRGPDDDGPVGDANAVAGTRRSIERTVRRAFEAFQLPEDEQYGSAIMYVDFYGEIPVPVWWPAYYMARAAHTTQDSFSHMLRDRSSGLHKVVNVLNYVDAVTLSYEEARDGLPHSGASDSCAGQTEQAVAAATEATMELMRTARLARTGDYEPALQAFLDRWFTLIPDCNVENQMCGNPEALEIARQKPTGPYLPLQRKRSKRQAKKK